MSWYFGDRNEPASYLSDNGWLLTEIKLQDLLTANGFQTVRGRICRCLISSCQRQVAMETWYLLPQASTRGAIPLRLVNELVEIGRHMMTFRSDASPGFDDCPPPPGLTG